MNEEQIIPALVLPPTNWTSKANAKFNQTEDRAMLAFDFIDLRSGAKGTFHCEATQEAKEAIGLTDLVYSDLSKSPVRLFQLTFEMKKSGMNSYATFAKIGVMAEKLHYEIKQ